MRRSPAVRGWRGLTVLPPQSPLANLPIAVATAKATSPPTNIGTPIPGSGFAEKKVATAPKKIANNAPSMTNIPTKPTMNLRHPIHRVSQASGSREDRCPGFKPGRSSVPEELVGLVPFAVALSRRLTISVQPRAPVYVHHRAPVGCSARLGRLRILWAPTVRLSHPVVEHGPVTYYFLLGFV